MQGKNQMELAWERARLKWERNQTEPYDEAYVLSFKKAFEEEYELAFEQGL
jgi:hypothetical protein